MRTMGAIDADTIVVTSVHDSQVVDIPEELVCEQKNGTAETGLSCF